MIKSITLHLLYIFNTYISNIRCYPIDTDQERRFDYACSSNSIQNSFNQSNHASQSYVGDNSGIYQNRNVDNNNTLNTNSFQNYNTPLSYSNQSDSNNQISNGICSGSSIQSDINTTIDYNQGSCNFEKSSNSYQRNLDDLLCFNQHHPTHHNDLFDFDQNDLDNLLGFDKNDSTSL